MPTTSHRLTAGQKERDEMKIQVQFPFNIEADFRPNDMRYFCNAAGMVDFEYQRHANGYDEIDITGVTLAEVTPLDAGDALPIDLPYYVTLWIQGNDDTQEYMMAHARHKYE